MVKVVRWSMHEHVPEAIKKAVSWYITAPAVLSLGDSTVGRWVIQLEGVTWKSHLGPCSFLSTTDWFLFPFNPKMYHYLLVSCCCFSSHILGYLRTALYSIVGDRPHTTKPENQKKGGKITVPDSLLYEYGTSTGVGSLLITRARTKLFRKATPPVFSSNLLLHARSNLKNRSLRAFNAAEQNVL